MGFETSLKEKIKNAFPIRNGNIEFIDNEIEKLKKYYLSTNIGREKAELFLENYLKENQQEYYLKVCVNKL